MSQEAEAEAVPEQTAPAQPKGLLQQMEELMAALTADLSRLDADLSGSRPALSDASADITAGAPTGVAAGTSADITADITADRADSS
ncbi:hypothetical protein [Streptomyces poonensis]|uniref:Uncharacterized protein n=1 Tax=Streptomyces poonensis TaxID=68255 RepID=A0A918Q9G2_9ACTN|nr:hypothetical protein [Streptomyces poonensis]GGZ37114.1 hypothetical protein GCM10010365_67460 [Streptomyces poonensis]GLJ90147.1 hypothetical protein GCM10017589_27480 [Streptomyces poonensis]